MPVNFLNRFLCRIRHKWVWSTKPHFDGSSLYWSLTEVWHCERCGKKRLLEIPPVPDYMKKGVSEQ